MCLERRCKMFEATKGQLLELLIQILDGRIYGDAVQEFIEKGNSIAWPRILKRFFDQARKTAKKITDAYWQAKAFAAIAGALAEAKDFDQARKTAEKITYAYLQVEAFAAIAGASREAKDFDQARKTAEKITDAYLQAKAFAAIAGALAKFIN